MNKPLVSVLVPCCNVEKYVRQCLESIKHQTLKNIEIICINDGSKDNTLDILLDYERQDERFIVIDKPNTGYGDSMNVGISRCRGDYIGIVESDDFIEPNMFEVLYQTAQDNQLDIARCCYFRHCNGKDTPVMNEFVPKNIVIQPLNTQKVFYQAPAIWVGLYNRSWLLENKIGFLPTPGASYQDTSFAFKTYALAKRFLMVDIPLLHYRTDNQNSSVNNPGKVFCVCDEWDEIYRFARVNPQVFEALRRIIPVLQMGTYMWNLHRLKDELKMDFLKRWSYECKQHFKNGEFKWSELKSFKMKLKLFVLCSSPRLFCKLWGS